MKNIYSILNEIEIEIEQNRDSVLQKVPLIDKAIFFLNYKNQRITLFS